MLPEVALAALVCAGFLCASIAQALIDLRERGAARLPVPLWLSGATFTLLLSAVVVFLDQPRWWHLASNGVAVAAAMLVGPMLPSVENVNRRVPLAGSRFNPLPAE